MKIPWFCSISHHTHASEWEANNCMELTEQLELATWQLLGYVREDEVTAAVNAILVDDEDQEDA